MESREVDHELRQREITFVVFGSTGDLATNRLIPAIGRLVGGKPPGRIRVVGVDARQPKQRPLAMSRFVKGDLRETSTYEALESTLSEMSLPQGGELIFYLATGPDLFRVIVSNLRASGLNRGGHGRPKIAIEKPFGLDLEGAKALQRGLDLAFGEDQVYRVDHYLGKALVRELMRIRSDLGLERLWNRSFVEQVDVVADESFGVDGRGEFYDGVGVVGDMVQNHLLQLMCLVAAERSNKGALEKAKLRVLESVKTPSLEDAVVGQYEGYADVEGVRLGSSTPTFMRLALRVDSERWRGVPFILRSGKMLEEDLTEVVLCFKSSHTSTVKKARVRWNRLRLRLDSPEDVEIGTVDASPAGRSERGFTPVFEVARSKETEYERIVRDIAAGDRDFFVGRGFNEASWRIFGHLLQQLGARGAGVVRAYERGTKGPPVSEAKGTRGSHGPRRPRVSFMLL